MSEKINLKIKLFCPCNECECYQKTANKITKDGVYTTKNDKQSRQRFYCHGGNHRFSETRYSGLFGFGGNFQEYEQVTKLSTYGLSSEAIADVLNRDPRTIDKWLAAIGKKSEQFHLFICLTMKLKLMMSSGHIVGPNLINYGCLLGLKPRPNFGLILNLAVEHNVRPIVWLSKLEILGIFLKNEC